MIKSHRVGPEKDNNDTSKILQLNKLSFGAATETSDFCLLEEHFFVLESR